MSEITINAESLRQLTDHARGKASQAKALEILPAMLTLCAGSAHQGNSTCTLAYSEQEKLGEGVMKCLNDLMIERGIESIYHDKRRTKCHWKW